MPPGRDRRQRRRRAAAVGGAALAAKKHHDAKEAQAAAPEQPPPAQAAEPAAAGGLTPDVMEQLKQLGELHEQIVLWAMKGGSISTIARTAAPAGQEMLQLRLTATEGDQMQFSWSADGTTWNTLDGGKAVDASYLPPWDRAVRVGLSAKGPANATAAFDWFRVDN